MQPHPVYAVTRAQLKTAQQRGKRGMQPRQHVDRPQPNDAPSQRRPAQSAPSHLPSLSSPSHRPVRICQRDNATTPSVRPAHTGRAIDGPVAKCHLRRCSAPLSSVCTTTVTGRSRHVTVSHIAVRQPFNRL